MTIRQSSFKIQFSTLAFAFVVNKPFYGRSVLLLFLVMKCRYGNSIPNKDQHLLIFVGLISSFLTREEDFKRSSSNRTCACSFVGFGNLSGLVLLLVSSPLVTSTISIMFTLFKSMHFLRASIVGQEN